MPTYVVSGFHNGAFRTYESKQKTIGDAISHAEALGVEIDTVQCRATREVVRKVGKDWTVEKYLPPKKVSSPGEHNALYLVSFFLPPIGLALGGFRMAFGLNGGGGALVASGLGVVAWVVGYVFLWPYVSGLIATP